MRELLAFLPLAAFMLAYYLRGLYFATAVLMVAMLVLLALDLLLTRKVPPMHLLSTALVLAFGSATLILRNPLFIQWKPTIFLWILSLAFLISGIVGKEPLAQRFLQPAFAARQIARGIWMRLNWSWVGFCALLGLANLQVALHASEGTWVLFKVIGITVAMLIFMVGQAIWLNARVPE